MHTIIVGCKYGEIVEAELPESPVEYTQTSYRLTHVTPRIMVFKSTKGQIIREKKIIEKEKQRMEKMKQKLEELQNLQSGNSGVYINEEAFLDDFSRDEEIEPAFVPKIPNRVLWVQYTVHDTLWLNMSGFDAGYVYEYSFDVEGPVKCTPVHNAENTEINSYLYM